MSDRSTKPYKEPKKGEAYPTKNKKRYRESNPNPETNRSGPCDTYCGVCQVTCHVGCAFDNDGKDRCAAMGWDKYCKGCKCFWNMHVNYDIEGELPPPTRKYNND